MNQIEEQAYLARITLGLSELRFNASELEKKLKEKHYVVKPYSKAQEEFTAHKLMPYKEKYKSFSCLLDNVPHIFYNDNLEGRGKVKRLVHEYGHVVLDHIYSPDKSSEQEEEAIEFTTYFLAPICYLSTLPIESIDDVRYYTLLDNDDCEKILGKISDFNKKYKDYSDIEKLLCERLGIKKPVAKKFNFLLFCKNHIISIAITGVLIAILSTITAIGLNRLAELQNAVTGILNQTNAISSGSESNSNYNKELSSNEMSIEPSESYIESDSSIVSVDGTDGLVYVTPTGSKYHKFGCQYLQGTDMLDLYISEAQEKGYTPCRICFPK